MNALGQALTSFIGRTVEVAGVSGLVGEHRLVTVTGPGGVGKTRLAGQVAALVAGKFADGARLAELSTVREPGLVAAAVASALGLRQAPGRDLVGWIASALSRRQLLLLLDNCEHVLDAVAELCDALLAAADDITVLATSREPIGIAGEARYRLGPMALPTSSDPADVAESEAVLLFADRARLAGACLEPEAAARIVQRLDGMPLAIELAAARAEALGVSGLADRLDDGLLSGTSRSGPARHRSLAATADWSYQLLRESERKIFRILGVFPGSFTLDAAEEVGGPEAAAAVVRLVDCSLLTPPRAGTDGRDRYVMLQTLRGYAAERLAQAGEEKVAMAALTGYALRTAESAAAGLERSGTELAAAALLDAEDAAVHRALSWALDHDPQAALRLALALAPWWSLRGQFGVGYRLLAKAAAGDEEGEPRWCAAQAWLGRLATGTDEAAGLPHFEAARDALAAGPAQAGESGRILVQALAGCADCLLNRGRIGEAADQAERALALAGEIGYPEGEARALMWLGACAYYSGDHAECMDLWGRIQQLDHRAITGAIARRSTLFLAAGLFDSGELALARAYCARTLASARSAGAPFDLADGLILLANVDLRGDAVGAASVRLREAIALSREIGNDLLVIDCLDAVGHLCARTGRHAEAVTMWAAVAAVRQASGVPDPPKDASRRARPRQLAQQALGPDRTLHAQARGTAMTLPIAAEYAALLAADEAAGQAETAGGPSLSARELELITLVAQGRTNNEIAAQLYISVRTVGSHLDRIRDKTGCRRRADLTRLALQINLV